MHIPIQRLLDLLTYDGLFNNVMLDSDLAEQIELEDSKHEVAYVEKFCDGKSVVWPIKAWIDECKRRKDIDETLAAIPKPTPKQQSNMDILAAMLKQLNEK